MTPYLNVRCDYFRHPKTERLVGLLGRGAEVLPIRLWAHCGEFHCEDGRLAGYTDEQIESKAGWWGERGKALDGLAKAGFVEKKKGAWRVTSWKEHQGHISALKLRGKRMAEARWSQYRRAKVADAHSNADSIAKRMHRQCSNQPTMPTDPTYQPKGSGGRGGARLGKALVGEPGRNGRFPLPDFTELPKPLFGEKAKAMLEDCEAVIAEIRKEGKSDLGVKDALGNALLTLLPEAKAAVKAWQRRMSQIRQARAG